MATDITPPESVSEPPLTPPPTEEKPSTRAQVVVDFFRRHQKGHRLSPWTEYQVDPNDYARLLRVLNADESLRSYVNDKVT